MATAAETVEWWKAAGYVATDLVETPALGDGTPWLSGWMKGDRRPGGLATPTWMPKTGNPQSWRAWRRGLGARNQLESDG